MPPIKEESVRVVELVWNSHMEPNRMHIRAIGAAIVAICITSSAFAIDREILKKEPVVFRESMFQGETAEIFIDVEGLRKTIRRKRNLDTRDSGKETLMSYAVADGNATAIRLLLNAGASTRLRFDYSPGSQLTVAHLAAELGCLRCLGTLIAADRWLLSAKNSNGETAIFQAVRGAQSEQVLLLWALGADISLKNKSGETIFDVVREPGEKMSAVFERIRSN